MRKNYTTLNEYILLLLLLLSDYLAIILAEYGAIIFRNFWLDGSDLHIKGVFQFLVLPLFFICSLVLKNLYTRKMQFWKILEVTFSAVFYGTAAVIVLLYSVKEAAHTSRMFIILTGCFAFVLIILFRYLIKNILNKFEILQTPLLIIGAGKTAELFLSAMQKDVGSSYKITGFLEDYQVEVSLRKYPVLGKFKDAAVVIQKYNIQNIVIAAPGLVQEKMVQLINTVQPMVKNLTIIPNLVEVPMSGIEAEGFFNEKIMLLRLKNNLASPLNRFIKYSFDFIATLIGMILISPILLAITILIKLDSPGAATFKHTRIGKDGKPFGCWKFRTMCVDADKRLTELLATSAEARKEWEESFKLKNDQRVTKVGKFLRKTSLDELPQVFNVLKGEMSLVGPRPVIADELPRYGEYLDDYLMVRPGITGMWQVNGRSDTTYDERVRMDSWYVRNWSFWIDIMLLWRTVKSVFMCKGAY